MLARTLSTLAICSLAALGCGGGPTRSTTPTEKVEPPSEHWETVSDRRFVYTERCGTGPFEVTFPATEIEYGRRTVVMVYGARGVELDNRIDGGVQWGIAMARVEEGDHARCRGDAGGEPVIVRGTPLTPGTGGGTGTPLKVVTKQPPKSGYSTPASELPQLVEYTGELPNVRQQAGAVGWFPKGDPFYYADEYWTSRSDNDRGKAGFRFRFWFNRPSDLGGLVFRFVDEKLVPDLPRAIYDRKFAERVADSNARRKAGQPIAAAESAKQDRMCKLFPEDAQCVERRRVRGRIPPAPQTETVPRAPSANVDWTPGYWSWSDEADDFLWIGGTFIVRPPPKVAAAPVVSPPPVIAPPAPAPVIEPVEPRTITAQIDPVPQPRVETITVPPAQPGAVWIAGHWRLVGASWQWVAGSWAQPPSAGERYRSPSINVRGAIRVYLPGRWIRVR